MSPNTVSTPLAPGAIGPYSQGKAAHGFIFVSGQLPLDPETGIMPKDIQDQTIQSMKNILAIVKAAGGSEKSIVRCGIFVRDMERFGDINAAYAQFFEEDPPARFVVEVSALPKGASIEIEAIAAM
jgi:2-iminobutanoate/2-iminopropanoate deaminase